MRVYIAEKPSLGAEIAKCLPGPMERKDGYIITGGGIITWGFGHILRLADPKEYDEKYQKWCMEDLPIVPRNWKLRIAENCAKQFHIIENLLEKATEIVHAGDPDREGQLLIDEVLEYLNNKKPVHRILLNALDEKSIKKALGSLRPNEEFKNMKMSALARQRGDWLVGMNASRAYTLAAKRAGYSMVLPVGRVKTPTLALVVRREKEIQNFKPVDYFQIRAHLECEHRYFTAAWVPKDTQEGLDSANRLVDVAVAKALKERFDKAREQAVVTKCEMTEQKELQRLPFSLSALQVEAGKQHGYSPKKVLDIAQSLYEKKVTTYPRSDCQYLPETQLKEAKTIIANLSFIADAQLAVWANKADLTIKSRAWNNKKVTAHHAIIPTLAACDVTALNEAERNVYVLVAKAYLAQFYPVHEYNQAKIEMTWVNELFKASGRTVIVEGWKILYTTEDADDKTEEGTNETLPNVKVDSFVDVLKTTVTKKVTKPPERFTTTTLLQAMKEIHKYVKSSEVKKILKDVLGIGTEATRATIIEDLIKFNFVVEKKKRLYPTEEATVLIDLLPDDLTYPDTTAVWENHLREFTGIEDFNVFMQNQEEFITRLCTHAVSADMVRNTKNQNPCPVCGKGELRLRKGVNGKFWGCNQYPECRASFEDNKGKPQTSLHSCPECKEGILRLRSGSKGSFWGCSKFPNCKAIYADHRGKPKITSKIGRKTS